METINRLESEVRGYVRSFPKVFSTGKANWLTAEDGTKYLDFFSGAGATSLRWTSPLSACPHGPRASAALGFGC